jgi:putative ABC transport system ATP-binding protein
MINHPRLLLADEPTGALDSATGKQVIELFRQLNQEGVAILMITHDASIAACADRQVTILDGVLTEGNYGKDE